MARARRQVNTVRLPQSEGQANWVIETFGVKSDTPEASDLSLELATKLLLAMTERQREVALLRFNNLSFREVAEFLGITQQSANSAFIRGMERARSALPMEGEWEDAGELPKVVYDYYQRTGMSRGKKYIGNTRVAMMQKALHLRSEGLSYDGIAFKLKCSSYLVKELLIEAAHKGIKLSSERTPE